MLELKDIKKDYPAGDGMVHALKGVSLQFRKNEFVSILGPSGCGKTTMLNIIGGLDQYTSGDLVINGKPTKDFKDRDWDSYRNHSIGFVFQSYNLIPHQTVLQNVELALTLSGVSKSERKARAIKALEEVGLGNQLKKKPSEMSGGQMQRVAIARALVNNPDIILADEPTGALDTETSVQVMEILKKIAKDRLIIMVTHNPELAKEYSTRIINILDGEIKADSAPLTEEELKKEKERDEELLKGAKKVKLPSMSFGTSFSLSLKNLMTKKGRTILTAFAGSIGIIGIALILSISEGLSGYINSVQEETLSSYPLTIQQTETDMTSIMEVFMGVNSDDIEHDKDAVYTKPALYDIMNAMSNLETKENDLKSFKRYIESEVANSDSKLYKAVNGIQYGYNLDLQVYTKTVDDVVLRSDLQKLMADLTLEYMDFDMNAMSSAMANNPMGIDTSSMMPGGGRKLWQEMLPGKDGEIVSDVLKKQYDVVYGAWPNAYNEIVLVLDENNELNDMTLYALGLESKEEVGKIIESALNKTAIEYNNNSWSYEEICNMEFRTVLNSDCYSYDENTGLYSDLRDSKTGMKYLYDNGIPLKVTGIIRPKEEVEAPMLSGNIGYTSDLTKYVIEHAKDAEVIKAQMQDESMDVLTGLPFKANTGSLTNEEKERELKEYLSKMDPRQKAIIYVKIKGIPSQGEVDATVSQSMEGMQRVDMETIMLQAFTQQMGMQESEIRDYISNMTDEDVAEIYKQMVIEQFKRQYATQAQAQLASMQPAELVGALDAELPTYTTEQNALYYDEVMEFSDNNYEGNLTAMGYLDLESPSSVNIYASTFDNKDLIEEAIKEYNEGVDEVSKIQYTDYVGIMMSSVSTIINAITYVLIAFVAISLIVSSIMIAVITLISVQERTKEIGILRAIGASKRNVSNMFNAETVIIGFASGLLGVVVTYLLCIPINAVIHSLTGIAGLNAFLPLGAAIILILISMFLNLISGIIPSRSAAKKDPVVALRSE